MPLPLNPGPLDGPLIEGRADGVQAVIDVAQAATQPRVLERGQYHVLALGNGQHERVDLTGDEWLDTPRRKRGTTTVRDVDSFLPYFAKHSDANSEVFADVRQLRITAVLDAHTGTGPRWSGHRLVLELRKTDTWQEWMGIDGRLLEQKAFAEFIEDHLPDLVDPVAVIMLEIAQSFEATTSAAFESSERLASGERRFQFTEEVEARAGKRGEIVIPAAVKLGIQPFDGADRYPVTGRFRYRLEKQTLRLGLKLERPGDVLERAFRDTVTAVGEGVPQAVLNGCPASDRG